MKRFLAFLLALISVLGMLAACGDEKEPAANNNTPITPIQPEEEVRTYDTAVQEAVVAVAEAYYARRTFIQYEDNPLIKSGAQLRADRHKYSPEDATKQFTTYSNCATFTFDVYKEALDLDIVAWTCSRLQAAKDMHVLTVDKKLAEEEKADMVQKIKDVLQPGDIVSYLKDNWGHAMLYIGYEEVIHCSSNGGVGGSYNMASNTEVIDPAGGIYKMSWNEFFPGGKHSLVDMDQFCIVRPTVRHPDAAPNEKTINRVANLQNIYVEKTSSHAIGMTAMPGDEVTFTFSLKNSRKTDAVIEITETVPTNSTYVSGADTVDGNNLKWSVTVPGNGGKVDVTYTVKVNADAKTGDTIVGDAKVGGVEVRCQPVYIGGSLLPFEQEKIYNAATTISSNATGTALAKEIYAAAGFGCSIGTEAEIISSIYKTTTRAAGHFELNTTSKYMNMLVPTMYGGYLVYTNAGLYDGNRTKAPMLSQLMAGDIVVCKEGSIYNTYLFIGQNKAMSLNKGSVGVLDVVKTRDALFSTIGHDQFVVIRPSMAY